MKFSELVKLLEGNGFNLNGTLAHEQLLTRAFASVYGYNGSAFF
jgi:hypothetical protein